MPGAEAGGVAKGVTAPRRQARQPAVTRRGLARTGAMVAAAPNRCDAATAPPKNRLLYNQKKYQLEIFVFLISIDAD
jgi:hypothetical protein